MVEAALGLRVVRGPDWEWGDQDGGKGFVGTVAGLEEGGSVIVQWDMGQKCRYRCGRDNKFDLRVLDSGPGGQVFSKHRCHVCCKKKVYGVVWRCLHCPEYYLCSACYMANYHCSLHRFTCLLNASGKGFQVPAREDSRSAPASGIFSGAKVVRGPDWRWRDQDGGEGKTGKVEEVLGWSNEGGSRSERSVALVTWESGNRKKYRVGHKGKVDLKCVTPGSGGFYYPEHLPVLGQIVEPHDPGDIVTGDRIKCEVNFDQPHGPEVAEKIGLMLDHSGTVNIVMENGDFLVRYPGNSLIPVNPAAAKKVDVPMFEPGDVVRMISDMAEVYRLQQGHGEWNDDMALCLDQVGKVMKNVGEANVLVSIAGYRWTLNPLCVRHAPGETVSPESNTQTGLPMLEGLSLLIDSLGPGILVHATARGDINTIQTFLQRHPDQVNAIEQGKSAVHVAVEESRLKALELILKFKPDLSTEDGDGDTPLHTCAYLNAIQAASILLDAGADVNVRNTKRGITPIMIAGAVGHYDLLEIITTHHTADVNVQDSMGQTALHHVLASHRTRAIPILLSAGANLTLLNSNLFTPLIEAAGHGNLPGVEDIVRQRPDLIDWQRPDDGVTALQLASVRNRLFIVRHLALSGCDLNIMGGQHARTALPMAAIEGNLAIIECLVGYGCDINTKDAAENTALHIVFVNKNAQPLSNFTPQMNKVQEELNKLPLESVPRYLIVGCFLIQEGANPRVRNSMGQTPAQACSSNYRDILLNYLNKSNRGEFHGSLKRHGGSSATSKTDNRPSGVSDLAASPPQQSSRSGELAVSGASGLDRDGSRITSIMEAQHHGGASGGHRERDRLRLHEARRRTEESSQSEDSSTPTSEELERIRKHRQAYFALQEAKNKATTSTPAGKETEDQQKGVEAKSKEHQTTRVGNPPLSEGKPQQKVRGEAGIKANGSVSKQAQRNRGANSVKTSSGHQQKRRVNENSELAQKNPADVSKGEKKESGQSQQQGVGGVSPVDTTLSLPFPQPQSHSMDRANASVLCFVCESPASAKFTPCGHNVACKTCATRAKRCPICKVLVTGVY